jgi:hypothetical protein
LVQQTKAEYEEAIKALKAMNGMEKEVARLTAEMNQVYGPKVAASGAIELDATPEEFEKAGSKFAKEGNHVSEFREPFWETPGVSLSFPFTIVAGPDTGIEGKISAGVSKSAMWKIKEILLGLGVAYTTNSNGKIVFNPSDVAGKKALTKWQTMKDTRPVEEGGKGTEYTKPVSVLKIE